ncbi:MAG: flippase-like domain-containing protein [Chloroflexales bacterium]|nr:flippase-like domain-containing protein [Chloroflexales bacterium]
MRNTIIRVLLSVVLLGWLIAQVDMASVGAILAQTRPGWLMLGILANMIAVLLAAWRWRVLLVGMGVRQSFGNLLRIVLAGTFFSMFLPSSVGGDIMKMVLIAPDTRRREAAISSVLMDRVVGMAVTIVVGLLAVLFLPAVWGDTTVMGTLAVATALFCLGVAALFSRTLITLLGRLTPGFIWRRIGGKVLKVHESIADLRGRPDVLIGSATISGLRQIAICTSVFCAGQAFGIAASPVAYFAIIPITLAITVLPIAINGLGLQDNALILLLGTVGVGAAEALSLSIFIHAMRNLTGLIGGLVFAIGRRRSPTPEPSPAPESPAELVEGAASERDQLQLVR